MNDDVRELDPGEIAAVSGGLSIERLPGWTPPGKPPSGYDLPTDVPHGPVIRPPLPRPPGDLPLRPPGEFTNGPFPFDGRFPLLP